MKRRALLAASTGSLAGLAGCTGAVRRRLSGRVEMDLATTVFHPADEPWFADGLSASSSADHHAALFTRPPPDDADVFTDDYPRQEQSMDNDLRNDDYSTGFLLLFEAKMPVEEAYGVAPTILHGDLRWSGWRTVSTPMARDPRDPETLEFDDDADELVATTLVRYETPTTPEKAVVTVYDEGTGGRVLRTTVRPRFRS